MKNYKILFKTTNNTETIYVRSNWSAKKLNQYADERAYQFFDLTEMEIDDDFDNWSNINTISDNYSYSIEEISILPENYEVWV